MICTVNSKLRASRRKFAVTALGVGMLFASGAPQMAWAQDKYPEKAITLIVGFPPGGGGDLYGRLIGNALSQVLGRTVVVENKPGAGGNIAAGMVAKAPADGYTLLLSMSGNLAVSPALRPETLPYDAMHDFAHVGLILEAPHGLFVAPDSRFSDAKSVLEAAQTEELTFASTGTGGAAHIGMERIVALSKSKMLHIPYRGSGPAITDLIGGQVNMFFATASPLMSQVRQGALKLLAVTGEKRSESLPDVPTFREIGVDMSMTQWYGLSAPAGTPSTVMKKLSQALSQALKDEKVRQMIRQDAAMERDLPLEKFAAYIQQDIEQYRAVMTPALAKQLGIQQ